MRRADAIQHSANSRFHSGAAPKCRLGRMAFLFSSVAAGRSQSWLIRAMDGRNHSAVGFWNKGAGPIRRKVPSLSLFFSLSSSSSFLSYVRRGIYAGADCLVRGTLSVISGGWPFLFFLSLHLVWRLCDPPPVLTAHTQFSLFLAQTPPGLSLSLRELAPRRYRLKYSPLFLAAFFCARPPFNDNKWSPGS